MELVNEPNGAIDMLTTPVHLGLGARALPIDGFAWDPRVLEAYGQAVAGDGVEGRLVMIFDEGDSWTSWEHHPAGDELVICLAGRLTMIREMDGGENRVELGPGEALINPAGVWHTADIAEPTRILTITPGQGTDHRPR